MRAAVYYQNGGPEVLRYEEVPDPTCPADGMVVAIDVISLEGGDTLHRGYTPFTDMPHIVGYQSAGRVIEVGREVKGFAVGEEVVAIGANGSHAERVVARPGTTWKVPAGADLTAVACVPVAFGTAHEALFDLGKLKAGERVLVHAGGGGVGLAAIQLAKIAGAEVLTTASSDGKLARLKELGASHGINYKTESLKDAVTRAVGKEGVDSVIDPVGGKTLEDSVDCLRFRGRIVNLGFASLFTPFQLRALWGKNASITGMSLMTSLQRDHARTYGVIAECISRVAKGELKVLIDRKFPLAEAAAAHAYIEGRGAFGRVVMLPKGA